jgi:hypothetical protein
VKLVELNGLTITGPENEDIEAYQGESVSDLETPRKADCDWNRVKMTEAFYPCSIGSIDYVQKRDLESHDV